MSSRCMDDILQYLGQRTDESRDSGCLDMNDMKPFNT